ncbi:tyrosine-type recombinase/integrase [Membranihabitans maritimus]|uniref:tyrosine-type recombinase/integrase n=1 Tax=Membranihabitans maritimus TaxID=2904244 RepID=UPI001F1FCB2A|nr:tyrosine-type recombinase/integrase [Membranihabitans maritimus]
MREHDKGPGNRQLRIQPVVHRNQRVWLVTFPYSTELYHRCKSLGGLYTRTYKGWWWPANEISRKSLQHQLLKGQYTTKNNGNQHENPAVESSISAKVSDKIRRMEVWMRQKRYSENTINAYLSFVRQFFATRPDLRWNGIKKEDIIKYNFDYYISGNKSYSSQNQWINAIKLYLKVHGLDVGELTDIDRPRKEHTLPNVLTKDEVKRILVSTRNKKHKFLLSIIYGAGLRIGETLRLRKPDIRPSEKLIYIRRSKGKKDRRVPLSIALIKMYEDYCAGFQPHNYVFEGQGGGQYSHSSARKVLKRACKAAGINLKVTLHTLRHSYATHLLESGVGLRYIQEILGHNSPKTTMIYTHVSGQQLSEVKSPIDDMEI